QQLQRESHAAEDGAFARAGSTGPSVGGDGVSWESVNPALSPSTLPPASFPFSHSRATSIIRITVRTGLRPVRAVTTEAFPPFRNAARLVSVPKPISEPPRIPHAQPAGGKSKAALPESSTAT